MRPYWAVWSARFRLLLQYRSAALAGIGTQVFWGWLRVMVFAAFYASTTQPQPLSLPQMISYVWLGQALLLLSMPGFDNDVRQMIRTGTVAYELLRPVDLYGLWYARAVAFRTAPLLLRAVPQFVLAGLCFGLLRPPTVASAAAFAAALVIAVALVAALSVLATITLLWTVEGYGIGRLIMLLPYVLGGVMVPIPLLPDWLQTILAWLPFRSLADLPFRLYLGQIPASQAPLLLGGQIVWLALLIAYSRWLLRRGLRHLVAQGG